MKQYTLTHEGLTVDVEFDLGMLFWYRARLIVNDEPVDERAVFWGTTRLRTSNPRPVVVDAKTGFFGPKTPVLRDHAESIPFDKRS
ncbi:hypothetical protein [Garicola koreensis]|uniref:Uncharacterized protein n=1 Tax=Garicola koreensis TaxID=1262554 RepID=A0A7W5TT24_9MICC|nr:hypothetical protein [Garicola koreensis]MBB3667263.1 hypothetical protein [Garicola koreensis]